jgi:hypothetical protein
MAIAVAIATLALVGWFTRWHTKRRRFLRQTAVAQGNSNLSNSLLGAGAITESPHERGLNEYDFRLIRRNACLLRRLRKERPLLLDALEARVFRYL